MGILILLDDSSAHKAIYSVRDCTVRKQNLRCALYTCFASLCIQHETLHELAWEHAPERLTGIWVVTQNTVAIL